MKKDQISDLFFDSREVAFALIDQEKKILIANSTFAEFIKKPLGEILSANLYECCQEMIPETTKDAIKNVFEKGTKEVIEYVLPIGHFRIFIFPAFAYEYKIGLAAICIIDVTQEKKFKEELRFERDQLFSIFNSIDQAIYVADMETYEILFANDYLKMMFGRELVGGICYKEFQGKDSPCEFCTNPIIKELKGSAYRWEYYNPILNRYFDTTDRVIKWPDGRDVRLEIAIDITERKHAEIKLQLSEELNRSTIYHLREGFVRTTVDGKIFFANESYAKMYGYSSPQELINSVKNIAHDLYVNPEDRKRLIEILEKQGFVENFELQRKRKDGKKIWVSLNARAIKDEKGKILFIEGTSIDITEKKIASQMAEEERRKFFVLAQNLPFGVVLADHDGNYLYVNPKFKEITGYTLEDVPNGREFVKKAYPDDKLRHEIVSMWKEDVKKLELGEAITRTLPVTCKDGSIKRIAITTVHLAEGLYVMTFEDVTEKEKNEILLRESEKRFRSIFENAQEGIFQSTKDGQLVIANPRLVQMLGYSSLEELKSSIKNVRDELYVNPLDRDKIIELIEKEGKVENFETKLYRKDGNIITVNLTVWPVYDESGNFLYIQGIQEDVTERKKREEELNSLREQFLQAQKMEALGRLSGAIAHDFNNILSVILGTCEIALSDLKNEEKVRKSLMRIVRSAEKASSLIKQLLTYSRRQIIELEILDLNEILIQMEDMLRRLVGENIEILTYFQPDLGKIKANRANLEQVVMNLIVNAKDAMPEGGKIIIETYNVELGEDYARTHFGVSPGQYVVFSITDTGCGIPKDILPHIFEPFFTTKERGKGTGLGLSTVYGIVKQHEGHIFVYSEEGKGTTFKIYLPRLKEKEEKKALEKERRSKVTLVPSEITILLIEDDENVLSVISDMIKSLGFNVISAQNASEALDYAASFEKGIDLILTDVVIPGMKTTELVVRIRKIHPQAKVLFMSGYTENAIAQNGILAPGVNFIQKPFSLEELKEKIIEVLSYA